MFDPGKLPSTDFPLTPLGAALRECEEYCVACCCGMDAFNISAEHMQRWAKSASVAEVMQARREIEEAIETLEVAPERFYYLDCEHSRQEVTDWCRAIGCVLAEVLPPA